MFNFNLVLQTLEVFYFYFSLELDVVKAHIKLKKFFFCLFEGWLI